MPDSRKNPSSLRGRVLVVDDEYEMRYLTRAFLEHAFPHVEIVDVEDGPQALALLPNSRFDVVVSDYRMPRMDGYTLLASAVQWVDPSSCILMTAYSDQALQERARAAGLRFVDKGGDPENIVAAVGLILGQPRGPRRSATQ